MFAIDPLAVPNIFFVKSHQVLKTLLDELSPLCSFVDFFGLGLIDDLCLRNLGLFLLNGSFFALLRHIKLSVLSHHNSRGHLLRTAIFGVRVQEASHLIEVLGWVVEVNQLGKSMPVHLSGCVAFWNIANCRAVTVLRS